MKNPQRQQQWDTFKRTKRGYWSFIIFSVLFILSLGAEFIANDKPLIVKYEESYYFPVFKNYAETTFGGDFETEANYKDLLKDALILQSPDLALIGTKGGDVVLKVFDKKNDTSNSSTIVVGQNATADYTFYFKVENMKMLDGDYDVSVSSKSISYFKNKTKPIEYWIALESDSTITK